MTTTKKLRDEEFVQEADVTLDGIDLDEAKRAFAFVSKLRSEAVDKLGVDESEEEEGTTVTQVDYRIEDGKVVVHVLQGLVD
jgi:hypothetical protein